MNKEKEIEEMYDEIYADIAIQFGAGDYIEGDDREVLAKQIVKHLQEWGYRKADEVRKETAKEILKSLYDEFSKRVEVVSETRGALYSYSIFGQAKSVVSYMAKQYGVEVDE